MDFEISLPSTDYNLEMVSAGWCVCVRDFRPDWNQILIGSNCDTFKEMSFQEKIIQSCDYFSPLVENYLHGNYELCMPVHFLLSIFKLAISL